MHDPKDSQIVEAHKTLTQSNKDRLLLPKSVRRQALRQLHKALIDNEEQIFSALKADLGKSRFESFVAEIAFVNEEIKCALKSLDAWSKKRVVKTPIAFQPGTSYIEPTPKGVVLIIAPWNYPFQLSLVALASAIAAGNCVIVKPSELASESANVIANIINNYLDPRCFRAICGDKTTAQTLLDLPFDHIFYTGSTAVGIEVMKKAAVHLTPVTLELGGKSPCIIDRSADLSLAAKRILWGKCLNAGQTCIAPDYILMEKDLVNDFVAHAKRHLNAMFGDNNKMSDSFGRIVNGQHFERLLKYLHNGRIVHGGAFDAEDLYLEPTLLVDVSPESPVMQDEIFGPILPIMGVDSLHDAISFVNDKPNPLALYVFSNDKKNIKLVLDRTISGGITINDCISHVAIIDLPFGGIRHSGIGSYHGVHGFETFSHMRSVHKRANILDMPIKYPPYSEKKLKLARILL